MYTEEKPRSHALFYPLRPNWRNRNPLTLPYILRHSYLGLKILHPSFWVLGYVTGPLFGVWSLYTVYEDAGFSLTSLEHRLVGGRVLSTQAQWHRYKRIAIWEALLPRIRLCMKLFVCVNLW